MAAMHGSMISHWNWAFWNHFTSTHDNCTEISFREVLQRGGEHMRLRVRRGSLQTSGLNLCQGTSDYCYTTREAITDVKEWCPQQAVQHCYNTSIPPGGSALDSTIWKQSNGTARFGKHSLETLRRLSLEILRRLQFWKHSKRA